ncbi:MAG: hypothetical protein BZ136_03815 [Methanosphaera sp. rholeuAM74]|nr:MAG: hypothetical protein BZ136_03815 [Methanosphaera sp. rholeuAM74]
MSHKLILLANYLRDDGVEVSTRTNMLAKELLDTVPMDSIEELHSCLSAIYIKNVEETGKFNRAFDRAFRDIKIKEEKSRTASCDDMGEASIADLISDNASEDLELLESLYDDMFEKRAKNRARDGQIVDSSMVLLDTYDPRVFQLCKRLSKKIANKRSSRMKKSKSRHVDMSKTIRANMKYGGHILKLIYDKPHFHKSRHVFLCDVSGSCEWVTSWFFTLLYGCKETFDRVEIYCFDNKVTDITDLLGREKFENIGQVNIAQKRSGIHCYGQSDMASSFEEFLGMVNLNNRTDVIILTDCRDWKGERIDGTLKSAMLMRDMLELARNVIILNPEKKIRWNNATSCVEDYERAGASVYETSSLEKFEKVISML